MGCCMSHSFFEKVSRTTNNIFYSAIFINYKRMLSMKWFWILMEWQSVLQKEKVHITFTYHRIMRHTWSKR
jgi:hypothetical protein